MASYPRDPEPPTLEPGTYLTFIVAGEEREMVVDAIGRHEDGSVTAMLVDKVSWDYSHKTLIEKLLEP